MTSNRHELRRIASLAALALVLTGAPACSSKQALTPEQQSQADLSEYEAQVRRIIPDPARADQLVALANQFQELAQASIANINEYRSQLSALNSNYEATRADYEALFGQQDAAREAFFEKAGALRARIVVYTSDAEWEQLKALHLRLVEADLQQLVE